MAEKIKINDLFDFSNVKTLEEFEKTLENITKDLKTMQAVSDSLSKSLKKDFDTINKEAKKMEKKEVVTGIAIDENIAKVGILKVPDKPGTAAKIFGALADERINVYMIVQSVHPSGTAADMACTVKRADINKAVEVTNK